MINLLTHTITRTRYAAGEWINGRFAKGDATDSSISASVQPLRSNEILLLPEGRRTTEALKIYTKDRLFTSDEKAQTPADILTIDGVRYEVHMTEAWNLNGSNQEHYKSIALKMDGEGGTIQT